MTIFGGNGVEFFKETFDLDLSEYVSENKAKIGECLGTVVLGKKSDRELFNSAVERMDEKNKEEFIAEWYDKKQSSLNGIGQRAMSLAKALTK